MYEIKYRKIKKIILTLNHDEGSFFHDNIPAHVKVEIKISEHFSY